MKRPAVYTLMTLLVAAVVLGGLASPAGAFSTTLYTDKTAWQTALGGPFSQESFDDATLNPGISVVSTKGTVTGGYWSDQIDASPLQTTTFSFTPDIIAFGGNWDLAGPGGAGTGIILTLIGGSTYQVPTELPDTIAGSFWGIISDTAFTSVLLTQGTQSGVCETFHMDDLVYAPAGGGGGQVPVPGAVWLLGSGLAGLVGLRKRVKS